MYQLRLDRDDKRAFHHALRGDNESPEHDPDTVIDEPIDESTDDPKAGDTPTTPGSDPGANPMRLVTANIQHGMTVPEKREDITKVRGLGSVIMWQELGNRESQAIIAAELPPSDWHHLPGPTRPTDRLSLRKAHWDVEMSTSYLMHKKFPGVRGQRETYTTVALVTSKTGGIQFLVAAAHFTPHAWCNHAVPAKQWRKDHWNIHYDKMQSIVLDARSKGITVIGGGDWNRGDVAKFHTSQVWLKHVNLDYLFAVPATGGASFTLNSAQSVTGVNTDHPVLVAELAWTPGSNPLKSNYHWPGSDMPSGRTVRFQLDVLNLDGEVLSSIDQRIADGGQVNIATDAEGPTRSMPLDIHDPEHRLRLDSDAPTNGALYADRMLRAWYGVLVPRVGWVDTPVFTGPLVQGLRDGEMFRTECQGKEIIAQRPVWEVFNVEKDVPKTEAIRRIMRECAGETFVDIPDLKVRMGAPASLTPEPPDKRAKFNANNPWALCQAIAASMGMQLFYNGLGILRLRRLPGNPVFVFDETVIQTEVSVKFDITRLKNAVQVTGKTLHEGKEKKGPQLPTDVVTGRAVAPPEHPLSPRRLGRKLADGRIRGGHIPEFVTNDAVRNDREADNLAEQILDRRLMQQLDVAFDSLVVPHLEELDLVRVQYEDMAMRLRLERFTIPLTHAGVMSIGDVKRVTELHEGAALMDDLLAGLVDSVKRLAVGTQTTADAPAAAHTTAAAAIGDTVLTLDSTAAMTTTGGTVTINGVETAYASSTSTTITLTQPLTAALDAGAVVAPPASRILLVDDASRMISSGGQVTIGGIPVTYAAADDDAATVTLAEPLTDPLPEGTELLLSPVREDVTALVLIAGQSDPIPATVPHNWHDALPSGQRAEGEREKVWLTRDGQWSLAVFNVEGPTLVRQGPVRIASDDDGIAGGLNEFGDVTGRNMSYQGDFDAAGDTFLIDGMTIGELLAAFLPRGVGPKGGVWGSRTPAISGQSSEYGLLDVAWLPPDDCADRLYRLTVSSGAQADTADTTLTYRIRYTTDGSTPSITSPILATFDSAIRKVGAAGARRAVGLPLFEPASTGEHRFLLTLQATDPTSAKWTTVDASEFLLEDVGWKDGNAAASNTGGGTLTAGATDGGGTTTPAAQIKTVPYTAIATSWWEGDNLTDDRESDNQYVGYAGSRPEEGNRRSAMLFDSAAIQADHAGATIIGVRLRMTVWEGGNDKTLLIGSHASAALGSSWNALSSKVMNRTRLAHINEGSSPWVDLSAWGDKQGWATGALRGLLVGPGMTAGGALSNDPAYKFSYRGAQWEKPALRPVLEITSAS